MEAFAIGLLLFLTLALFFLLLKIKNSRVYYLMMFIFFTIGEIILIPTIILMVYYLFDVHECSMSPHCFNETGLLALIYLLAFSIGGALILSGSTLGIKYLIIKNND